MSEAEKRSMRRQGFDLRVTREAVALGKQGVSNMKPITLWQDTANFTGVNRKDLQIGDDKVIYQTDGSVETWLVGFWSTRAMTLDDFLNGGHFNATYHLTEKAATKAQRQRIIEHRKSTIEQMDLALQRLCAA